MAAKHDAAVVFKYIYNYVYGNVLKKELELKDVLAENFQDGQLLE